MRAALSQSIHCARKECRLIRSAWYGDILSPGVGPSGFKSEALSPLGLMCIARAIGVPLSVSPLTSEMSPNRYVRLV